MTYISTSRQIAPLLNHYLRSDPSKTAFYYGYKSYGMSFFGKIYLISTVALTALIFAIAYGGLTLSSPLSIIAGAIAISILIGAPLAGKFNAWANHYSRLSQIESGVHLNLKNIIHWNVAQVEQFLNEQELNKELIPLESLRIKNSEEPLLALLPLIARFQYFKHLSLTLETKSKKELAGTDMTSSELPPDMKRRNKLMRRQNGWNIHELDAIPRALDAAVILQIIQEPTRNLSMEILGSFQSKSFEERMFDRQYAPKNDNYFLFHNVNRKPLSLREIEENIEPKTLRARLFRQPLA